MLIFYKDLIENMNMFFCFFNSIFMCKEIKINLKKIKILFLNKVGLKNCG